MVEVLVIDNIDSFVYNLVQYIGELGAKPKVKINDISIEKIKTLNPEKIVISPGPGRPENAGNIIKIIQEFGPKIPILGVCLGHQGIAVAFDGTVGLSKNLMHGKVSVIKHDGKGIFKGIKNPFEGTRYHSLVVEEETLPDCFEVSARAIDEFEEIMAMRHKDFPIKGVQFHPESILTEEGKKIIKNFLDGE
ncbi:MAG: aminodeoxychorismate/anthranilate synthase component II [Candidatus Helarchaeota archaeon]|nr:aminodeoxychorismate/anthranilate synthase component II [Candidatus Helarchaeota archaeon]